MTLQVIVLLMTTTLALVRTLLSTDNVADDSGQNVDKDGNGVRGDDDSSWNVVD